MQKALVTCINKNDRLNPYERITHVGGPGWKLTTNQVITEILTGNWAFYVELPYGHSVRLVVARSPYGNRYVKTESDGEHPNNLLSLPECK
ncbi:DUF3892 domain-containing protein [Candidatus Saccharibacteria bacterium]|nr:DUF3892 domain-containing protein [Candidatus Saccharibacteria bacterium]